MRVRGPIARHLAAGAEDQADAALLLLVREPARDVGVRNHPVQQAFLAAGRFTGGIHLQVEAPVGRIALHVEAGRLQALAERLARLLLDPVGERLAIDFEREVEPQVSHEIAAHELAVVRTVGGARKRLEGQPRRFDAAEGQDHRRRRRDGQEAPAAVDEQVDARHAIPVALAAVAEDRRDNQARDVRVGHDEEPGAGIGFAAGVPARRHEQRQAAELVRREDARHEGLGLHRDRRNPGPGDRRPSGAGGQLGDRRLQPCLQGLVQTECFASGSTGPSIGSKTKSSAGFTPISNSTAS